MLFNVIVRHGWEQKHIIRTSLQLSNYEASGIGTARLQNQTSVVGMCGFKVIPSMP